MRKAVVAVQTVRCFSSRSRHVEYSTGHRLYFIQARSFGRFKANSLQMTATDAMARNELQVGASGGGGGKFSLGVARASHCRL